MVAEVQLNIFVDAQELWGDGGFYRCSIDQETDILLCSSKDLHFLAFRERPLSFIQLKTTAGELRVSLYNLCIHIAEIKFFVN